jgi:DNA-binding transcriptional ArsR family regulator
VLDPSHFSVLASPRRREILRIVWKEERSAGDIHREMPDVTFGAVSQHLRALVEAGLLSARPDQTRRYYKARRDALGPVARFLEGMWGDALSRLKVAAELEQARRGPRPRRRQSNRKDRTP